MKVLITGVAGFVGSNLAIKLINDGHSIIGIDDLSHGSMINLDSILDHENFKLDIMDLTDDSCNTSNYKFDIMVHLASQKIPRYSNSYKTINDNSIMLSNAIDGCLKNKARLLFSSTSDVYGKNKDIPFSEDSDLVLGRTDIKRWAYAVSKMHSEHSIIATHEEKGLDYTIMRFFSCYGENQNITWWGGPQGLFIQNILEGKPVEIHGTGNQTRCFTYVGDLIDGIVRCIYSDKAVNEIFNIGNPNTTISITELANLINYIMKRKAKLVYVPYEKFGKYEDVMARTPDISKIKSILGFNPEYYLSDGLERTIKWQTHKFNNA